MKQKDKITEWVYEEYKKYVTEHDKVPDLLADEQIVEAVLDKINEVQIWIPDGEIYDYYRRKKPQLQKRLDNEKLIEFKSYVSFYKSIVDQDRASVVICNLKHEIIYMNPAAVTSYAKRGGDKLIGRSLLDGHKKRRLPTKPGKTAFPLLKRKIKGGKQPPCPEGTWRSDASEGRRRPHPPSQAPEQPFSRWTPSFLPKPSKPLHGRP